MGDITDDEKIRIAQQFLLSSPPGEFNEVITDVRGLLNDDNLLNQTALSAFKAFNVSQSLPVEVPGADYKAIVCEHSEVDAKHYRDPRGKQAFEFDQVKQEAGSCAPDEGTGDEELEALRESLDAALSEYVYDYYVEGAVGIYPLRDEEGQPQFKVVISSHKYSPKNYWNGRWTSVWTISINGDQAKCEATIKIDVHFYEDGNVQLNCDVTKSSDITLEDAANPGPQVAKHFKAVELGYQETLNDVYQNMSQQTLKLLRRELPITKTKLDFHKIAHHKVAGDLASK